MKPGIPWSVKGVEPGLREAAKTAARRSGMTLGEWLNSAINEQAEAVAEAPVPAPKFKMPPRARHVEAPAYHPIERAASKLEDIADKLSRLALVETEGSFRGPQNAESQFTMAKVLSRVESNERQTVEAFTAVNDRLSSISKQISRSQLAPPPVKIEETPGFLSLEKAVRNIVEHLEVSDKRTRENMKSLQDRISDMAMRASQSNNEQLLRQTPAFNQLENRLTDLARKLEHAPAQAPFSDQLRTEIDHLASRIETVRESSEMLANRAQTQAVQAAQAELRTIETRIVGLLNEAKQSIVANHVGPAEFQRFRQEIDKLNKRIDDASRGNASDSEVSALKVAIEQLSTRVAQGQDPRPIADLDRKILEISQKLERAETGNVANPQINELERRFAELDQRLTQTLVNPTPNNGGQLSQKLVEVDERLARTEQQLTHLDTIERAIAQLYDAFEQSRKQPAPVVGANGEAVAAPLSLAGAPEIAALENGLQAVRQAAANSDQRNQETLEAVHETLEQIVTKLAELETVAIGQRVGHAVSAPDAVSSASPAVHAAEPQVSYSNQQPEPAYVAGNNPFDSAAQSEPAIGASSDNGISDLIAAARRLHQSGSGQGQTINTIVPGSGSKAKSGGRFTLPFMNGADVNVGKAANANGGSKRRLVLLGILLLAMATFATTNMVARMHRTAPATPTAIEEQVAPAPLNNNNAEPALIAPAAPQGQQGEVAPSEAQPIPAPVTPPDAKAAPKQQSDASDVMSDQVMDPIATGAVSKAAAPVGLPKAISPDKTSGSATTSASVATLDAAVGPVKLREAAMSGDINAQFVVATHYLNGDTLAVDYSKAAYWYGKAAAAGLAPAQYRLATLYERGSGVEKNLATALSWYERAGALGNVKAMHNAAVIAAGNEAGAPDYARAFKWFSLAASHGLKDSEFNLAVLMERGLGSKQDTSEALFWYLAASGQNDMDAKARVTALSKTLSPTVVDSVKSRFKAWVPEKAPEAANVVAVSDAQWNPSASAPAPSTPKRS